MLLHISTTVTVLKLFICAQAQKGGHMCGIAGFCNIRADYTNENHKWHKVLNNMKQSLVHRGPDAEGELLTPQAGLAHRRLSIIDLSRGGQPMTREKFGCSYSTS